MKTILKGIEKMKNKELKSKVISENFSLRLDGKIELKKGSFKSSFIYYCYVFGLKEFKNVFCIDDLNLEDDEYFFDSLKIDSITDFRSTINKFGIDEIKNIFEISEDEKRRFAIESINKSEILNKVHPNFILLDMLTDDEKRNLFFESKPIEELKKLPKYILKIFNVTEEDLKEIDNNN